MATDPRNDARINIRLPSELKETIEEAAFAVGQTLSEFAVSTVVREARQVLHNEFRSLAFRIAIVTVFSKHWMPLTAGRTLR
jgi:uncharacterized protein (DUF1778 family)